MKRFVEGADHGQSTLFPAVLDDYVGEDNPVPVRRILPVKRSAPPGSVLVLPHSR